MGAEPAEMAATASDFFTVYSQGEHLLFQFILSEYLVAFPEVQVVENVLHQLEDYLMGHGVDLSRPLSELTNAIACFAGSAFEEEQPFPWVPSKGSLGKLKHCCHLFPGDIPGFKSTAADIKSHASRSYHSVLQARELIVHVRNPVDEKRERANIKRLIGLLFNLSESIRKLAHLFIPLMHRYKDNENVLYYLLSHQRELDKLYGASFLRTLARDLFAGGVNELAELLRSRYKQRGFEHIVPSIESAISDLGGYG